MKNIVIFAAGKGSRMSEITTHTPKSLVQIQGKPILQHILELVLQHDFQQIIINTHHLSDQITAFIQNFTLGNKNLPKILIEHEPILLETGGTIKKLAKIYDLGNKIFTINSDVIIRPHNNLNPFAIMENYYNQNNPDFLLLLTDKKNAVGYVGKGDFEIDAAHNIYRPNKSEYQYMFTGLQIVNPMIVSSYNADIFSLKEFYPSIGTSSLENIKIKAVEMVGNWYHATSIKDIENINRALD